MAKVTIAQEVSTGTPESFTVHELNDPEPHLALLRNRPTLRDEPAQEQELVVPPEDVEETQEELEEFDSELEEESEEDELEPQPEPQPDPEVKATPAKKAPAKKATARRKNTEDFDFE